MAGFSEAKLEATAAAAALDTIEFPPAAEYVPALMEPGDPDFELSTPMLVMPFTTFTELGAIQMSDRAWRQKALDNKWIFPFARRRADGVVEVAKGYKVVFVSHNWWHRPKNVQTHDVGAPDYQEPEEKKNLKWRMVGEGIKALIAKESLVAERVVVWFDWFCIYQDVPAIKGNGVRSLIRFVTLSDYMLVPLEDATYKEGEQRAHFSHVYASRAWCRSEHFIFQLWAEMHRKPDTPADNVPLYSVAVWPRHSSRSHSSHCSHAAPSLLALMCATLTQSNGLSGFCRCSHPPPRAAAARRFTLPVSQDQYP